MGSSAASRIGSIEARGRGSPGADASTTTLAVAPATLADASTVVDTIAEAFLTDPTWS